MLVAVGGIPVVVVGVQRLGEQGRLVGKQPAVLLAVVLGEGQEVVVEAEVGDLFFAVEKI